MEARLSSRCENWQGLAAPVQWEAADQPAGNQLHASAAGQLRHFTTHPRVHPSAACSVDST